MENKSEEAKALLWEKVLAFKTQVEITEDKIKMLNKT